MDRWLCVFLLGFAVSFLGSTSTDIWQCLLFAGLAALSFLLSVRYQLPTFFLGWLLCGILWGTGNAYFTQQTALDAQWTKTNLLAVMHITQVSHHQPGVWRITGTLSTINDESLKRQLKARLQWYQPHANGPQRIPRQGETWRFKLRLRHPQGTRNEGSMLYHRYLVGQSYDALGSIRSGHYLSGQVGWRQRIVTGVYAALNGRQQAGPLMALVVGERFLMSAETWTVVQRTGLAHLIAISGLHLSLVAGFSLLLLWRLSAPLVRTRKARETSCLWRYVPWLALGMAFVYAWLAGFAIATLRAVLMLTVVVLHKHLAWHVTPPRLFLRAVTVVILIEPTAPLTTSFWLSVGAVAAILLMSWRWPRYRGRWAKLREWWRFEWLITLLFWPLMSLWFGGISLAAALINLVVVPVVSLWILPLGLLAVVAVLGGELAVAERIFMLAEWPLVKLWPGLMWLAEQPWQWLQAALLPLWPWLFGAVVMLLLPLGWRYRWIMFCTLGFSYMVVNALPKRHELVINMLDVEQGSALVLERQGHALLIDTGASWEGSVSMAERIVTPFLEQQRLQPELGFITHTDSDHQGGQPFLAKRYPMVRWFGGRSPLPCIAGQEGDWRGVKWHVLHPYDAGGIGNQHNNQSCVLMLQFDALKILVTGDIETSAERALLARVAPIEADILIVPHHGSNSSSEHYFIRHVKPSLALVSRGRNNPYGQVHPAVVERYQQHRIPLLDTARGGQIKVWSDGRYWRVWQPLAAHHGAWFDADPYAIQPHP
ncbi:ComE operon protein 3 [Pseudidiomarina piscicola]|uniref:ComE operon protein 3 n=1 Tax=Pseudidiomarina piscicola TaxID=2614830 RepID=A0A6S6WLV9_9GAMM|nr:DNA internalization-related competence protein ComEC/Rec2 [Pseudidiomarina piscicola]CAB0150257.1 ComE operon protein 3 [Pseudidiomarina piscicola]VZT39686.1 ComE operon protein 3 [Pseudomonas aeruginosa]